EDVAAERELVGREVDAAPSGARVWIVDSHPLAIGLREAALTGVEGLTLVVGPERAVALERLEVRGEYVTVVGNRDLGVSTSVLAIRLAYGYASYRVPLDALVIR